VFLFAKCLITLSKSSCPAMLDSMFNLARSTSRVCDIADRKWFLTRLSLLKNLSADTTVAGIVTNILKVIQTFGNNSHKPHGQQVGDHCFKALPKYCKWLVSPVCFKIIRYLGMSVNPKLTFDSTLHQLAAHV